MRQNVSGSRSNSGFASEADGTDFSDTLAKRSELGGLTVFLIDDSADIRMLLERFLKRAGAKVEVFESAQVALERLKTQRPDFIVSDVGMPDLDGYSFMQRYRKFEAEIGRQRVPATALTAFTQTHHAEIAIASGFDEYLTKPISSEDLVDIVRQLAGPDAKAS